MIERTLGHTGLRVTRVGFGAAHVRGTDGQRPLDDGVVLVHAAVDAGLTYVDTSECYPRSEETLGIALAERDERDDLVLATKFGHTDTGVDYSAAGVLASAHQSRQRLGRSVDVLQIHTPPVPAWDEVFGPGGAVEGMKEARASGLCRFLGVTGHDVEFLRRAVATGAFDTMLAFLCYDLIDQSGEQLLSDASNAGVGVILASPLRMGMFGAGRDFMVARSTDAEVRRLHALEALFHDYPGGITAAAFQFALSSPHVDVVLSGPSTPAELLGILRAAEHDLPPDYVDAVREIAACDAAGVGR